MSVMSWIDTVRMGKMPWQMKLKGKMFSANTPKTAHSDVPEVVFAIPLVAKARASDWGVVMECLNDTLTSLFNQTDDRWKVVICGQDRPDLPDDPRISFLKANIRHRFYDKGDKRRLLINHIAKTLGSDCYYAQFDADDILHPDAVAHILRDNNGRGYIVDQGYFVSLDAGYVTPLEQFDFYCGSCSFVYADFRTSTRDRKLLREHRSHMQIAEYSELFGRPLDTMGFPAVLYVTGHGDNMEHRFQSLEKRTIALASKALPNDQAQDVMETFKFDRLTLRDQ